MLEWFGTGASFLVPMYSYVGASDMSVTSSNGQPEGDSNDLERESALRQYIGIAKDQSPADLHRWLAELRDEE